MTDLAATTGLLKRNLAEWRFGHCIRVAETAERLARQFGADPEKAYLAGLLHDCAKAYSADEILAFARRMDLPLTMAQIVEPHTMLHGQAGAYVARRDYGVEDGEVLRAISRHQSGAADMTVLDSVVRLADSIEPGRSGERVEKMREIAEHSLEEALLFGISTMIPILIAHGLYLEPDTAVYYNQLLFHKLSQSTDP